MFDERIQVKIRSSQVMKLILTGFVVVQENTKPSGRNAQTVGLYIFLYNAKPVSLRIFVCLFVCQLT